MTSELILGPLGGFKTQHRSKGNRGNDRNRDHVPYIIVKSWNIITSIKII